MKRLRTFLSSALTSFGLVSNGGPPAHADLSEEELAKLLENRMTCPNYGHNGSGSCRCPSPFPAIACLQAHLVTPEKVREAMIKKEAWLAEAKEVVRASDA